MQQAHAYRQRVRLPLAVTAMSKRGPKSERRSAKQASKQAQPQPAQQQQAEQTADQVPRAVEEAAQPQAPRPLAEQPVSTDDGANTVGDRILPRILLFSGLPVLLGLLLLPGFYYLKVRPCTACLRPECTILSDWQIQTSCQRAH